MRKDNIKNKLANGTISSFNLWNGNNFATVENAKEIEVLRIDDTANYMDGCARERFPFSAETLLALEAELKETAERLTAVERVTERNLVRLEIRIRGYYSDIDVESSGWRSSGKIHTIGEDFNYLHTEIKCKKYTKKVTSYKSRYEVVGKALRVDGIPYGNRGDNSHAFREDVEIINDEILFETEVKDENLDTSEVVLEWVIHLTLRWQPNSKRGFFALY